MVPLELVPHRKSRSDYLLRHRALLRVLARWCLRISGRIACIGQRHGVAEVGVGSRWSVRIGFTKGPETPGIEPSRKAIKLAYGMGSFRWAIKVR